MLNFEENLAIIAGDGDLPKEVVKYCESVGCKYTVFSINNNDIHENYAVDYKYNIGQSSKIFSKLHELNIKNILMVGKAHRPTIFEFNLDLRTIKFILGVGFNAFRKNSIIGDDYLLRKVICEIEKEGFNVIGIEEILSDHFLSPGLFTVNSPTIREDKEINVGLIASKRLGYNDLGQSVVLNNGLIIGEESYQGTDYLIKNLNYNDQNYLNPILVKTVKPNQDRRIDLPVIGLTTIDLCISYGFRGIVVEANGTLINDKDYVIKKCNEKGLFLMSVDCSLVEYK